MEEKEENKSKEEVQESELLKIQREKYEKIIEDKNKIIKDLLNNNGTNNGKAEKKQDEEDEEEKAKKLEEERRKKRSEYYKKYIR